MIARVSASQGSQIKLVITTAARIARPPSLGVGASWSERSFGRSMAPILRATRSVTGTRSRARIPATRKAKRASRLVGIAIEPEGEGHQPPDLTAQVLLTGAVAVDQRGDRRRVEAALAGERRRRQHLAGIALQRAPEPGPEGDGEHLLG